ncbi:L-arabinitol 4-dehydrogenase [Tulasnella sp. 330]|nr:L-arabinitol 4-dehydrogenase [Tulasnella sp. 330]KAG8879968.1 L-arabinitol 4-dehydrogenase [Tulasnella sp. 331]KAG8886456.1 L-arabinitol 4-dehydrogenase [Tulasnella sp. 332]
MSTSTNTTLKPNVGVYTDPAHKLYLDAAAPSLEDIESNKALQEGEVLLEMKATGICGSDIHFWHHGRIGPTMVVEAAHILGHESSGQILRVHPSVTHLKPGDRVAIEPTIPCFTCQPCLTGRYNGCEHVLFRSTPPIPGLLRRYIAHPATWVHKLPDNLSYEDGALLEPLSVALAGVDRANVRLGDSVLICGAGPIGLMVLLCAKAAGAAPIVITDIDARRLEFAKALVPSVKTFLVPMTKPPTAPQTLAEDLVKSEYFGASVDVALECTGVASSIATAVHASRFGGTVFVIGVGRDIVEMPFMACSVKEVDLKFQYRYANTWPKAIKLVQEDVIPSESLKKLVTHKFKLSEAEKAFQVTADGLGVKVMILAD